MKGTKVRATKAGARTRHEGTKQQPRSHEATKPRRAKLNPKSKTGRGGRQRGAGASPLEKGGLRGVHAALVILLAAGCHAPTTATAPRQDTSAMSDIVFLHYLAAAPTVTVGEGQRAISMLLDRPDAACTKESWGLVDDAVLDKGTFAYMLRTACDLPRGVNEVVLADTVGLGDRRYALKTCIYEGLMPYGRASDPITGGELLSALTSAEYNTSCRADGG